MAEKNSYLKAIPLEVWSAPGVEALDGALCLTVVSHIRPKRIVHPGFGPLAGFLKDGALASGVSPLPSLELCSWDLENIPKLANSLSKGDLLVIDCQSVPSTIDLDALIFRVLTFLSLEVLVMFNGIDYPRFFESNAFFAGWLLGGAQDYKLEFASAFAASNHWLSKKVDQAFEGVAVEPRTGSSVLLRRNPSSISPIAGLDNLI